MVQGVQFYDDKRSGPQGDVFQMVTKFSQVTMGDRKSSEYGTPLTFFNKVHDIFRFTLDPCAFPDNRLNMPWFFTKDDDGLSKEWVWNTFINPPFGRKKGEDIRAWIRKMQQESDKNPSLFYVMLLPCRIESNWFQEMIFPDDTGVVFAIKGRLKFYNQETNKNNDPHPLGSVLYIRGKDLTTDMVYNLQRKIPGMYIHERSFQHCHSTYLHPGFPLL